MTIVRNVCLTRLKRRVLPSKVMVLDEAMREVEASDAGCVPASLIRAPMPNCWPSSSMHACARH